MLKDYRQILLENLSKRISVNTKYSLRAFARDLGISSGQLSLVLQGKKGISPERAKSFFEILGLSAEEKKLYLLQVSKDHARSAIKKKKAADELHSTKNDNHFQLTQDAFEVISEWYHFAILECLSLKDVRKAESHLQQIKLIAHKLVLQEIEVKTALERMIRLELVGKNKVYSVSHDTVFSTSGVPSTALRQFHSQILKKAATALETQTMEERYPNTVVLPILQKDFSNMKEEIIRFQKKMMKKYGRVVQGDGEQVYALTQQFFKLTEKK